MSQGSQKTRVIGAVFPILPEHVSNLFNCDRGIFVKFTKIDLNAGSKIVFYVSRQKLLVGQGKVDRIQRMKPDVAWFQYNRRIYLDKQDYEQYVTFSPIGKETRKMNEITVFELKQLEKFKRPVKAAFPVTPSGRYLTKELLEEIKNAKAAYADKKGSS